MSQCSEKTFFLRCLTLLSGISGSPLAASPTAPGLKFHLPPFKPNHNQGIKAEELLKMLDQF